MGTTRTPPHTASRPHAGADAPQPKAPRGPEPPARQPPTAPGRGQVRSKGPIPVPTHPSTLPYHTPLSLPRGDCQLDDWHYLRLADGHNRSPSARWYPAPSSTPAAAAAEGKNGGSTPQPHTGMSLAASGTVPHSAEPRHPVPPGHRMDHSHRGTPTASSSDTGGHRAHTEPQTPPYHHPGRHPTRIQ